MNTKTQSMIWSGLLMAGLLIAVPAAQAQSEGGERPKKERREGGSGERLEMLRERLGLTDAQVAQLKPILAAEREELAAKRKELGKDADRETVREAMREIHEKYQPQIQAVLTAEQKEKLAKLRERREKKGGGPGGPGGGGPGGGGPGGPGGDAAG